ncbi:MAG: hypothetical protein IPJ43_18790 [Saprospiraceae bacterium]|nr:hypothetical protein [Saprospiraceae bacterium]
MVKQDVTMVGFKPRNKVCDEPSRPSLGGGEDHWSSGGHPRSRNGVFAKGFKTGLLGNIQIN